MRAARPRATPRSTRAGGVAAEGSKRVPHRGGSGTSRRCTRACSADGSAARHPPRPPGSCPDKSARVAPSAFTHPGQHSARKQVRVSVHTQCSTGAGEAGQRERRGTVGASTQREGRAKLGTGHERTGVHTQVRAGGWGMQRIHGMEWRWRGAGWLTWRAMRMTALTAIGPSFFGAT